MKNACFLAPIHEPKFNYGINFITSYNKFYDDDHVYLVFSSEEEKNNFAELAKDLRYRAIVCEPLRGQSPTTEKKFFGLQHIFNNSDFINVGVVDVDTEFFRNVDYSEFFSEYTKDNKIYGGSYWCSPVPIIMSPIKFFNDEEKEKLRIMTEDFKFYFWFNNIPVYHKDYFLEFINYINYNERVHELVWFDFDFIVYAYFLLLKNLASLNQIQDGDTKIEDIFIEAQPGINEESFKKIFSEITPMWIRNPIESELMSKTFMKVHVDWPEP